MQGRIQALLEKIQKKATYLIRNKRLIAGKCLPKIALKEYI
jgi:hypothetical protein